MSENMDVHIVTLPLGAYLGATHLPLVKLPAEGGGITVLKSHLCGPSAGTVIGGLLVTLTDVGTPALYGTIGTFAGTCVTAAGVVFAATIGTAYVAKDLWIGFDQTSGTVPAGTFLSLSYVMGK